SVVAGLVFAWGVLAYEWLEDIATTRGFRLAALGLVLVVLAAPIDDLWHRLFGLDVTLWSPPHLLALFGSAVSTLGCLLIAIEVYPVRSWAGRAALLLAGALLYGGIRVTLDPSWLLAYTYGGVLFHTFAMLAALILPLALVTAAQRGGDRLRLGRVRRVHLVSVHPAGLRAAHAVGLRDRGGARAHRRVRCRRRSRRALALGPADRRPAPGRRDPREAGGRRY